MPLIRRSTAADAAGHALLGGTASACGSSEDKADSESSATASADQQGDSGMKLPEGVPTSLDDLKKWKEGGRKDWDKWARDASDFANPVIKNFWRPSRMSKAKDSPNTLSTQR